MKTIKIFNILHKPYNIFKSNIVLNIHAGRSVIKETSKDGLLSENDIAWLRNNTIADNTGDNISILNRYFNEMTAIYWVWKNFNELKYIDAVGFMHYRRHFIFSDKLIISKDYYYDLGYSEENISDLLDKYDLIHPQFITSMKNQFIDMIGTEYCTLGGDKVHCLMYITIDIIKRLYPNYYFKILDILNGHETGSFCNMFIMKTELFYDYCNWIFPILFELHKQAGVNYNKGEERCVGWIAEMLTSIYIYIKSKEVDHKVVDVFDQNIIQNYTNRYITLQKIKFFFKHSKKYNDRIKKFQLYRTYFI